MSTLFYELLALFICIITSRTRGEAISTANYIVVKGQKSSLKWKDAQLDCKRKYKTNLATIINQQDAIEINNIIVSEKMNYGAHVGIKVPAEDTCRNTAGCDWSLCYSSLIFEHNNPQGIINKQTYYGRIFRTPRRGSFVGVVPHMKIKIGFVCNNPDGKYGKVDHTCKTFNHSIHNTTPIQSNDKYDGPASIAYFQTENNVKLDHVTELQCGDTLSEETDASHLVHYYKLKITRDMIQKYKSLLSVSTCCETTTDQCQDNSQKWSCNMFETADMTNQWEQYYNIHVPDIEWYYKQCAVSSLDTVLYVLYSKKGKLNLLYTSDDVNAVRCGNTAKSYIDLIQYGEGDYYIAVGGYQREYGSYFLQMTCQQYSFPATEQQLDPALIEHYNPPIEQDDESEEQDDKQEKTRDEIRQERFDTLKSKFSFLKCGNVIDGTFDIFKKKKDRNEYMKYHLTRIKPTRFPITISLCIDSFDARLYLLKENRDSASFNIITQRFYNYHSVNSAEKTSINWPCVKIVNLRIPRDRTDISYSPYYYIAVQTASYAMKQRAHPNSTSAEYTLKLECSPEPTPMPTRNPTSNPTSSPTKNPTIEPTNIPTKNPTTVPTKVPTKNPTHSPTNDPTINPTKFPTTNPTSEPTSIPTRDPTNSPTNEPTENPTFNPTLEPTVNPSNSPTNDPTEYTFPILPAQLKINERASLTMIPFITCGETIYDESNTPHDLVSYYRVTITNDMYQPSYLTTCPQNTSYPYSKYDTEIYMVQNDQIIDRSDELVQCPHNTLYYGSYMELSALRDGIYYAAVQGYNNEIGNFSITLICTPPPPKVSREAVMLAVFGTCGLMIFCFVLFYFYEWRIHSKRVNILKNKDHILVAQNDIHIEQSKCCCYTVKFDPDESEIDADENEEEKLDPRKIDSDKNVMDQLYDNEDVVELVLSHALNYCDAGEGMDIYQILALRYFDKESRFSCGIKPFYQVGLNIECISISPFIQTLIMAIVIAATQTLGVTVVMYKLLVAFYTDLMNEDNMDNICVMDAWRWEEVYSLKILSFLLSLTITFHVGIIIKGIQHSGLYEILNTLEPKHMTRIDGVVLWILQIGQIINLYVCLLSVVGSYFIIFESNQGEENEDGTTDYSHSGLDMILNAVALFFMLELDDVIVSAQDYNDCLKHLQLIIACYIPNKSINDDYDYHQYDGEIFICNCLTGNDRDEQQNEQMDVENFKNWDHIECANWIIDLNKEKYSKYKEPIKEVFESNKFNGHSFANIQKADLISFGINDFVDRNAIYQEIRIHFKNKNNTFVKYILPS
eukprot:398039_1